MAWPSGSVAVNAVPKSPVVFSSTAMLVAVLEGIVGGPPAAVLADHALDPSGLWARSWTSWLPASVRPPMVAVVDAPIWVWVSHRAGGLWPPRR